MLPGESETDDIRGLLKRFTEYQDSASAPARFDFEEIAELTQKLERLETKLNELLDRHEVTEEYVAALREAISNAKDDLPNLPKQVWYRVAAAKIVTTIKQVITSKEARSIAYEGAKKMLGLE